MNNCFCIDSIVYEQFLNNFVIENLLAKIDSSYIKGSIKIYQLIFLSKKLIRDKLKVYLRFKLSYSAKQKSVKKLG